MAVTIEIDGLAKQPGDKLTNADLEGRSWVMRWQAPYFGEVERRPVSIQPEENGAFYIDHGTHLRSGPMSLAFFKDGEWLRSNRQPWKMKPTHWSKIPGLPVALPSV